MIGYIQLGWDVACSLGREKVKGPIWKDPARDGSRWAQI